MRELGSNPVASQAKWDSPVPARSRRIIRPEKALTRRMQESEPHLRRLSGWTACDGDGNTPQVGLSRAGTMNNMQPVTLICKFGIAW